MSLKTNRPKQYQNIEELRYILENMKPNNIFRFRSQDTSCKGAFIKFENDTLHYINIGILLSDNTRKIRKSIIHRIIFLKKL